MAKKKVTKRADVTPIKRGRRRGHAKAGTAAEVRRQKAAFLKQLKASIGNVSHACECSGMTRKKAYDWRKSDNAFAEQWDAIVSCWTDQLEESAMRRAIHGGIKRNYDRNGNLISEEKVHETPLTIFMLRAKRRDIYGDKVEISLTPEEFAREVQSALVTEETAAENASDVHSSEDE